MSSPEASIEEILASIRKTFTDEPGAPGAVTPSPAATTIPSFRSAIEKPAAELATAPLPTPPKSRAALIDDELDDLIEKPSPKLGSADKVPASSPGVSPIEAAREKWANLLNPTHGGGNGISAKGHEHTIESPAPAPAAAAAATTGLFAPRKGGFYPPQPAARAEPDPPTPTATPAPAVAPSETGARPAPIPAAAPEPIPSPTLSLGAAPAPLTPTVTVPEPPAPRPGFIPFTESRVAATVVATPEPAPTPVPSTPSVVAEVPTASARALDDLVAGLNNVAQAPAEPVPASPVTAPEPIVPVNAAAATAAPVAAALGASTPETGPPASTAASRSFEDVVADMLRPLLEKWIDENMPRIVERALQRDAALGRKPGP